MNSFDRNRETEEKSKREIVPLLLKSFGGRIVSTASGSLSVELQEEAGDFLAQRANGNDFLSREYKSDVIGIELKAEEKFTGNLFVETWSNKQFWNPGWIYTSRADYLLYHFLDVEKCYVINMRALKHFCFTVQSPKTSYPGRLGDYREVCQKKHSQKNDTWGRLIPNADLESVDCMRVFWSRDKGLQFKF